jgi:two-component system cell cycle sensor histidine kinase/response regulator CckA
MSLLRSTLESTADGILVVDLQGRIIDYNSKFLEIWDMSEDVVPEGKTRDLVSPENAEYAMKHIIGQLINPDEFIAKVQELYSTPEKDSFDILEFIDGRLVERYSRPQYINYIPAGRVWSFRDITKRKIAEDELKKHRDKLEILVKERTKELEKSNKSLDDSLRVFVGREERILNLEREIKELKSK